MPKIARHTQQRIMEGLGLLFKQVNIFSLLVDYSNEAVTKVYKMELNFPKALNESVSTLATKYATNPEAVFREESVFYHWLGLSLLKLHKQAKQQLEADNQHIQLTLGEVKQAETDRMTSA